MRNTISEIAVPKGFAQWKDGQKFAYLYTHGGTIYDGEECARIAGYKRTTKWQSLLDQKYIKKWIDYYQQQASVQGIRSCIERQLFIHLLEIIKDIEYLKNIAENTNNEKNCISAISKVIETRFKLFALTGLKSESDTAVKVDIHNHVPANDGYRQMTQDELLREYGERFNEIQNISNN